MCMEREKLRMLINQSLSLAAAEIFELFERTIAEYEEQLCPSKEEKHTQHWKQHMTQEEDSGNNKPEQHTQHNTGVQQQQLERKEAASPDHQQERNHTPDQEVVPHIKEEQGKVWRSQEEEEAEKTTSVFTSVNVKSERDDEEKPESLQFHENSTEEKGKSEILKTESNFDPETSSKSDFDFVWESVNSDLEKPCSSFTCVTDQKEQAQENKQSQKGVKPFSCSVSGTRWRNKKHSSAHTTCHTKAGFSCSVCNRTFLWRGELASHMRIHTEEKPFSCSVTDARLTVASNLSSPVNGGVEEKRFTCPVCEESFSHRTFLLEHMRIHAGEKCSCSICGKRLYKYSLGRHMKTHVDEPLQKPFSCSVGGKRFTQHQALGQHKLIHAGEKLFSCSMCGKTFTHNGNLKRHMNVHTGEKPYSCSICGKSFAQNGNLKQHMTVHTGEKLFGCSVCGRSFTQSGTLKRHLAVHARVEQHSCGVCHQRFSELDSLHRHKCELSLLL